MGINNLLGNLYLEEAKEKYIAHKDYLHVPMVQEVYNDLIAIQQQKQEDMNTGINFYELKTQLADLGFNEPIVVDQLREFTLANELGLPNIELIKPVGNDHAYFTLFFGRDVEGQYELTCFDCSMENLTSPGTQHIQYFQPDVPAEDAIALLQLDQRWPTVTRDAFTQLNYVETQNKFFY